MLGDAMTEENYLVEQEKRACEQLITALRKTLRNALMNDVHWYKVLGIAIYQTADFCRENRNAETAELTAISLYALCLSVFEDLDQENQTPMTATILSTRSLVQRQFKVYLII